MCKDHDLQHYSIANRDLAREICCDDHEMASLLLDLATFDGLVAFIDKYKEYCEDARLGRIKAMADRLYTQFRHKAISHAGDIVNAWDTELADVVPY